jgi:hypothetical protein
MATRSAIGIIYNGTCEAVYCHWDGYLEGVGSTLIKNYDKTKLMQLIALGDISILGPEIGSKHKFELINKTKEEKDESKNWSRFYNRDRGDTDVGSGSFANYAEFYDHYIGCGCEYFYLFVDGKYFCSTAQDKTLRELAGELADQENPEGGNWSVA